MLLRLLFVVLTFTGCGERQDQATKEQEVEWAKDRAAFQKRAAERRAIFAACNQRASKGLHNPEHKGLGCPRCPCHTPKGRQCHYACTYVMADRSDVSLEQLHSAIEDFGSDLKPKASKEARRLAQELCACACE